MSLEDAKREFFSQLSGDNDTPATTKNHEATGNAETKQELSHGSAGKGNHEAQKQQRQQEHQERSTHKENVCIRKVYSHHSLADLVSTPAPIEYFIDDYIQKAATHMLFGDSGSGKTFVAIDIVIHIACPELDMWCNKDIEHGPVIFFAGEGTHGIKKRLKGEIMEHNINPATCPITVIDECFHLNDNKNHDYSIQNTIDNIRAIYEKPALIVVDTLHRFLEGSENDSQDIGTFIHACDLIVREFSCAVLIIHHTGNAQENKDRGRGSSSLRGDVDNELKVEAIGDTIRIDQTKRKEGEKITGLILDRKEVTLPPEWNRKNGRPETTLVLKYSPESTHAATAKKAEPQLKPSQTRARKFFTKAIRSYGVRIHDEKTGHELAAVYFEDWRTEAYHFDSADNPDTKRKHINQDRKYLIEETELITTRTIEGREYCCLDMQADGEELFRDAIITALIQHEQETAAAGSGKGETGQTE